MKTGLHSPLGEREILALVTKAVCRHDANTTLHSWLQPSADIVKTQHAFRDCSLLQTLQKHNTTLVTAAVCKHGKNTTLHSWLQSSADTVKTQYYTGHCTSQHYIGHSTSQHYIGHCTSQHYIRHCTSHHYIRHDIGDCSRLQALHPKTLHWTLQLTTLHWYQPECKIH